jgi:fimbrial chaperone protein
MADSLDLQSGAKRRCRLIGWALGSLLAANAAGAMGISPVLVELSPKARVASVTLTNPSAQAKTFQAQTLSWRQHEGVDQYAESGDLLVSPSIAQIGAGQTQVFRVVLRGAAPAQTEKAYRLILEDITDENERQKHQAMVYMLLRFNLPLFAAPSATARPALRWSQCAATAGQGCVRLDNDGNRRIRLSALNVQTQGWHQELAGGVTVLAGAWHQWTFDQAADVRMPWQISAQSEAGPLNAEVLVAPP